MGGSYIMPAALGALASNDLDNFIVAATPGGIERQEKNGQADLVSANSRLPKDMGDQSVYEKMGIKFLDDADDIFVNVVLPEGWRLEATDHAMHSYVVDHKGRRRIAVFYKAAFYDRSANMHPLRRYTVQTQYGQGAPYVAIMDCDKELKASEPTAERDYAALDQLTTAAREWLDDHYPDHKDPTAYWDD